MKLQLALLAYLTHLALGQQSQVPLSLEQNIASLLTSDTGAALVDSLSTFITSSFSKPQVEALLLQLLQKQDVVDVMQLTGHGEGLNEMRLVHVFGEETARNMTEGDKLRLLKNGLKFMDITDHVDLGKLNAQFLPTTNPAPSLVLEDRSLLHAMFDVLDDQHLRADIAKLSSFWNRSYQSRWGLLSSNWVFDQVSAVLLSSKTKAIKTSVHKFSHPFPQNSVIARLEAEDDPTNLEDKHLVILGAHQDSLNYALPFFRAPGADDDGSGTVTILQVLRSLISGGFTPPHGVAVEFHWYAAEEGGLLGSQAVAAGYEKEGKKVRGMLQMDMTAFVKPHSTPKIAFFKDMVDANLTTFGTQLVEEYIHLPWNLTTCGKQCGSDHMSWTKAGFPAMFATEGFFEDFPLNEIHTIKDDLDLNGYSFEHMLQFVKLGIAFIAELSAQPDESE